ncbi:MAG: glycosyltransferase [Phycisphaerales bacterium]
MRIVHYLKWLRWRDGGTVRAVLDLCAALAAAGHEVTILTADDEAAPAHWPRGEHTPATRVPRCVRLRVCDRLAEWRGTPTDEAASDRPTQWLDRPSLEIARRLIVGSDVLHLHGMWAPTNLQLAGIARHVRMPYVVTLHGMLKDWSMQNSPMRKRAFLSIFGRRFLRHAAAVHCTTNAELEQSSPRAPGAIFRVIPWFFEPPAVLPSVEEAGRLFPQMAAASHRILFLSRLNTQKGVDRLILAAGELRRRRAPFSLWLAGPSDPPEYQNTLQSLVREQGIEDATTFLGLIRGDDKWSLYRLADVFVLPTRQENFGYVLLEAMAAGAPVVTTKGADLWQELETIGACRVADPVDRQLPNEIEKILADPAAGARLCAVATSHAAHGYRPVRILADYEEMYGRVRTSTVS